MSAAAIENGTTAPSTPPEADRVSAAESRPIETRTDWSGPAPRREWICEGWLGHRLTLFTGHGGRGKSRLALQLAAAIASGTREPWLPGDQTVPYAAVDAGGSPVLIASWEDEGDEVHRRLESMARHLSWAAADCLGQRLHFADLAGEGPLWGPTQNDPTGTLTDTGTALQARAKEIRARLLIVDPRAAAYAGDENHRAQVRSFVSCWDRWAREHRCAVLLVDHLPKTASTRPGNRDEPSYSGSTDWHNAARSRWTLDEDKNGSLLRCEKSNYGSAPGLVRLSNRDGCAWFAAGTTENSRKSKFI